MPSDPYAPGIRCDVSANSPEDAEVIAERLRDAHKRAIRVDKTHFKLTVSNLEALQRLVE